MNKFLLQLIAKRIKVNGKIAYQRPESKLKQKFFDYLNASISKKKSSQKAKFSNREIEGGNELPPYPKPSEVSSGRKFKSFMKTIRFQTVL